MYYRHTQFGTAVLVASVVAALLVAGVSFRMGWSPLAVPILFLLLITALMFPSLTVKVDGTYLRCRFGFGVFRKRFLLNDIQNVKSVRNPWYSGWGVRLTSQGWVFSVSGYKAVEITLKGGDIYRIGTDTPDELIGAILAGKRES